MYERDALQALIREKALRFGDFTLASGKKASYYLDCRQITLDAQGARLVGEGMLEVLASDIPDLVGGMAIGADPITAAILTLAGVRGWPLRGVMVRKEAKQHGTGKLVEGPFREGEIHRHRGRRSHHRRLELVGDRALRGSRIESAARAGDHRSPGRWPRSVH